MSVIFRRATPADVEGAVPCIFSSGPAAFDHIFSHRTRINAHEYLARAFVQAGGEFGYTNHFVGELDGRVVATGAGFTGEDAKHFLWPVLKSIFLGYGPIQSIGVIRRGLQMEKMVEPPKGRNYCVAHLGVAPDLRGSGIGSQLIDFMLKDAASRNADVAFLDVSIENPKAQALYERFGFEVVAENISTMNNATARVPSHRRMVRPVG